MRNPVLREGFVAGVIGATAVALWFLLVDVLRGHPLFTPIALGRAFFGVFVGYDATAPDLPFLLAYTLLHYAAFVAIGVLVAAIVALAGREPSVLAGAIILFVVIEVGFQALLSAFRAFPLLGEIAWYNVAIGNLIAAVAMGTYFWRGHPELRQEIRVALESRE